MTIVSSLLLTLTLNDGGVSWGGSPKLLSNHPSVSMSSEKIVMDVYEDHVDVDCQFLFVNHGRKTTVKMGFPDGGLGASDPDEDKEASEAAKVPPVSVFTSFESWVDGKPAATKLERGARAKVWHTKAVTFPAHKSVKIRDVYAQSLGGGMIGDRNGHTGFMSEVYYVLHTGSSWRGRIGKSEILIQFHDTKLARPFHLVSAPQAFGGKTGDFKLMPKPGDIVWMGPSTPTVTGSTVHFVRRNWRPSEKDDIFLRFGAR